MKAQNRVGEKAKKHCSAAGREGTKMSEKQPCRAQGECRRAGGAAGRQQQFPCGLCRERPLAGQAVPLQPMGPTGSRSPRCSPPVGGGAPGGAGGCGLEEAAAHGEPPQEQGVWGELPPSRGGPVLEQFAPGGWMDGWTPWDGAVWEQCLRSCCLWAARVGSAGEGRHPVGGTPWGAGAGRDPEGHSAESALPVTIIVE